MQAVYVVIVADLKGAVDNKLLNLLISGVSVISAFDHNYVVALFFVKPLLYGIFVGNIRYLACQKQTVRVTAGEIEKLGRDITGFSEGIYPLALEMHSGGLRPAVTVQYRRDAYLFPGTDLRLTFDYDLRVLPAEEQALFTRQMPGIPVLEGNAVIMEIKYGGYLPKFVRHFTAMAESQLSVSKYALCREKMM